MGRRRRPPGPGEGPAPGGAGDVQSAIRMALTDAIAASRQAAPLSLNERFSALSVERAQGAVQPPPVATKGQAPAHGLAVFSGAQGPAGPPPPQGVQQQYPGHGRRPTWQQQQQNQGGHNQHHQQHGHGPPPGMQYPPPPHVMQQQQSLGVRPIIEKPQAGRYMNSWRGRGGGPKGYDDMGGEPGEIAKWDREGSWRNNRRGGFESGRGGANNAGSGRQRRGTGGVYQPPGMEGGGFGKPRGGGSHGGGGGPSLPPGIPLGPAVSPPPGMHPHDSAPPSFTAPIAPQVPAHIPAPPPGFESVASATAMEM